MLNESTPLLEKQSDPPSLSSSPTPTAYFLDGVHRRTPSSASAISAQGHETVNPLPSGAQRDEFAPRPISKDGRVVNQTSASKHMKASSIGGDLLNYITLKSRPNDVANAPSAEDKAAETGVVGTLLIPRKVPVKVEPKVYLANERTFLTWLHLVATLAAASVTILKFAADESAAGVIFGLILLPASLAFLVYSLYQCKYILFIEQFCSSIDNLSLVYFFVSDMRRAYMIQEHLPGPYIDVAGPTVLTVILIFSIIAQFSARLYHDMH